MSFNIALTGLQAATTDLGVIANNISNSNTTGFKSSRAEFADLYSSGNFSTPRGIVGLGTQLMAVTQQFSQGNLTTTGNPLDLAVDGTGFFRMNDAGAISYTRDGRFSINNEGFVVNSQGSVLTGFQADADGVVSSVLGDLQIPTENLEPNPSTRATVGVNLDSVATEPLLPFDYQDANTYNYTTAFEVFDSLGEAHSLELFFRKSATVNEWTLDMSVDGGDPSLITGGSNTLTFNSDGQLDTTALPMPLTIDIPFANGAANPLTMDVDMSTLTQFAGDSSTNTLFQDGFATGSLVGVSVGDDGVLFASYNNGQSRSIGQVSLVNFQSPNGLSTAGENRWLETSASGTPIVGSPGSGSLGNVRSGTLENSNVELTGELVNMISAQRNFQANAQVISTSDALTQTLLNLR